MSEGMSFGFGGEKLIEVKKFNLQNELNGLDKDADCIFNKVNELAILIDPSGAKTETFEKKTEEIAQLTREYWKLQLIKLTVMEAKKPRDYIEKGLQDEKVLETTTLLAELIDGRVGTGGDFGKEIFFSLFTAKDIAAGFPKYNNFLSATEINMQLLLCNLIPWYSERIALFGEKLQYLDEYQVNMLTPEQIQAIKKAGIKFPSNSPILKKINGETKDQPPMEKSKCCLLV